LRASATKQRAEGEDRVASVSARFAANALQARPHSELEAPRGERF
jgi:hypothetical protein